MDYNCEAHIKVVQWRENVAVSMKIVAKVFILVSIFNLAVYSLFMALEKAYSEESLEIGVSFHITNKDDFDASTYYIKITPDGNVKMMCGQGDALYLWNSKPYIDQDKPRYEYEMLLSESDAKELFNFAEYTCERYKEPYRYPGDGETFFTINIKYKNYRVDSYYDFELEHVPEELMLLKEFYDYVKEKTGFDEIKTKGTFIFPH